MEEAQEAYKSFGEAHNAAHIALDALMTALQQLDKAVRSEEFKADKKAGLLSQYLLGGKLFGTTSKAANAETPMPKPEPSQNEAQNQAMTGQQEQVDTKKQKWLSGCLAGCDKMIRRLWAEGLHNELLLLGKDGGDKHAIKEWLDWCTQDSEVQSIIKLGQKAETAFQEAHSKVHGRIEAWNAYQKAYAAAVKAATEGQKQAHDKSQRLSEERGAHCHSDNHVRQTGHQEQYQHTPHPGATHGYEGANNHRQAAQQSAQHAAQHSHRQDPWGDLGFRNERQRIPEHLLGSGLRTPHGVQPAAAGHQHFGQHGANAYQDSAHLLHRPGGPLAVHS